MKRTVQIVLPWPPSINHYWGSRGKGRFLKKEARAFREQVGWLAKHHDTFGTRRLRMEIVAYPPDRRCRDLDNMQKAPIDALMHAGMFKDDSQIDYLAIERGPVRKADPCILVTITEA